LAALPLSTNKSMEEYKGNRVILLRALSLFFALSAFYLLSLSAAPGLADEGPPDIEVTYIERKPKYERYDVNYSGELGYFDDYVPYYADAAVSLANAGARRWPEPGEIVTYTAFLLNRGSTAVTSFEYAWKIDGRMVSSGTYAGAIAPGAGRSLDLKRLWQAERQEVEVEIILPDDATPGNNKLAIQTDALSFFTLIEQGFDQAFSNNTAVVRNPSTAYATEWLQKHVQKLNQMLEQAGASTRVRYDKLAIVADGSAPDGCEPHCTMYDGAVPQIFLAADADPRLTGSSWYDAEEDLDYALLKDLAGQLGLVDLSRLNMDPQQNKVNGLPYAAPAGLMNRGDNFFDTHSAAALESWYGHRSGYSGQYLYDIPAQNTLYLEDVCGNPLRDISIKVYQKVNRLPGEEEIPDLVKFSGTSDSIGRFRLPNVLVDSTNFPQTETGNTLRPNPFGYISNQGENGLFLLELWNTEEKEYHFLDITDFNHAYWAGNTAEATYPITTGFLPDPLTGNLTLDKQANADIPAYYGGWCGVFAPSLPGYANDGDQSTSWCRDAISTGDYWQIDLGQVISPHKVVLYTNYRALRAEASLSGAFAGEQTLLFRMENGSGYDAYPQTFLFPPQGARYLRLTVERDQKWVHLSEVEIYAAEGPCRRYGLSLDPMIEPYVASPGTDIFYQLKITNKGSVADTFDIVAKGNAWPTVVPAAIGPLGPGKSRKVDLIVSIPANVAIGAVDIAAIKVTSQANPTKTVTARFVTAAGPYKQYLPLASDR
jgi:hypothetical protein